jgi:polyisoprenoid-binding protein YceI
MMVRFALFCFLLNLFAQVQGQTSGPDANRSVIQFAIRNFGVQVEGVFKEIGGTVKFNPADPGQSMFDIRIPVSSIHTGIALRDRHLKKSEYFDAEQYPDITFISTRVNQVGTEWRVEGKLTIKGVTREITFPFEVVTENNHQRFKALLKVNRRDYHVGGNSISMGDEVMVTVSVSVLAGR